MLYLILACRYLVGGVLLAAAVRKASGRATFAAFAGAVRRLGGIPTTLAPTAAGAVIGMEAATGAALVAGIAPAAALAAAVILFAAFTVVLVRALRVGSREPCLCLGRADEPVGWPQVWRNAGLIGTALLALAGAPLATAPPTVPGRLLCLAAAAVAVLVVVLLDDLIALFRA